MSDESETFDDGAWQAERDQLFAHQKDAAGTLGNFRRELLAEGFERGETLELVRDYFERLMQNARDDD